MNSLPFSAEELEAQHFDQPRDLTTEISLVDFSTMHPRDVAAILTDEVTNGMVDFNQLIKLKKMGKTIDEFFADERVKAFVEKEVSIHGTDNVRYGMKFIAKECAVKFNYEGCNHPGLEAAYRLRTQLDAYIKTLENELRSIPSGESRTVVIQEIVEDALQF